MSKVVPFKRPSQKKKARGKTLCGHGFHKWVADSGTRFDVRQGKLVTTYRCRRCGATKTTLS